MFIFLYCLILHKAEVCEVRIDAEFVRGMETRMYKIHRPQTYMACPEKVATLHTHIAAALRGCGIAKTRIFFMKRVRCWGSPCVEVPHAVTIRLSTTTLG